MNEFEKDYRKWSSVALLSIMLFVFIIVMLDVLLGFDIGRNMYVMAIVATGCVTTLISLTWIRILNSKLMRIGFVEQNIPASQETAEDRVITQEDIEMCVRKEGYVPQRENDYIIFKIAGETYEVYYQDEKFIIAKRFALRQDMDRTLLMESCSMVQDEIFMFRSYIHTYDNGQSLICFEVQTCVRLLAELERYFPYYLNLLTGAAERQKEFFFKMSEEKRKTAGRECSTGCCRA